MTANDAFQEANQPELEPQPGSYQPRQNCQELQPETELEEPPEPKQQPDLEPEVQPEPELEPEPELQPEPKEQPEQTLELQPEPQPEQVLELQLEEQPDQAPEQQPEPESTPEEQPEQAPELQPELQPEPEHQPEPEPRAPSLLTSPLPHYPPSPFASGGAATPPPHGQSFASLLLGVDATTGTVAVTSQLVQELVALQQRSHEQVLLLFCLTVVCLSYNSAFHMPYAVPHI